MKEISPGSQSATFSLRPANSSGDGRFSHDRTCPEAFSVSHPLCVCAHVCVMLFHALHTPMHEKYVT